MPRLGRYPKRGPYLLRLVQDLRLLQVQAPAAEDQGWSFGAFTFFTVEAGLLPGTVLQLAVLQHVNAFKNILDGEVPGFLSLGIIPDGVLNLLDPIPLLTLSLIKDLHKVERFIDFGCYLRFQVSHTLSHLGYSFRERRQRRRELGEADTHGARSRCRGRRGLHVPARAF